MKVLMLSPGVWPLPAPTGVETHVYHMSYKLAELGCEVDLVSDVREDANFHKNVTVHRVNLPLLLSYKFGFFGYTLRHAIGGILASKRGRELLKNNYSLIHAHGRLLPFLISTKKTPLIYTVHDDPPSRDSSHYFIYNTGYKIAIENMIRKADRIIIQQPNPKDYFLKLGIPQERIEFIPDGVDTRTFNPRTEGRKNHCLFVGSLIKRKGVDYLLKAIAKVNSPSCSIVGDGPEKPRLSKLTHSLGITTRVDFVGAVYERDKLAEIYQNSGFLVLPSTNEYFGRTLLEAMACGLPVIASKLPGPSTIVQDGYNGFLVEPGNVEALAEKIGLLSKSPNLRKEMGERALLTVKESYTWESVAKKTLHVYEELLNKG